MMTETARVMMTAARRAAVSTSTSTASRDAKRSQLQPVYDYLQQRRARQQLSLVEGNHWWWRSE